MSSTVEFYTETSLLLLAESFLIFLQPLFHLPCAFKKRKCLCPTLYLLTFIKYTKNIFFCIWTILHEKNSWNCLKSFIKFLKLLFIMQMRLSALSTVFFHNIVILYSHEENFFFLFKISSHFRVHCMRNSRSICFFSLHTAIHILQDFSVDAFVINFECLETMQVRSCRWYFNNNNGFRMLIFSARSHLLVIYSTQHHILLTVEYLDVYVGMKRTKSIIFLCIF